VDQAASLVDKVQFSFTSIMSKVRETTRSTKEIALSTQQQTSACVQMAETMTEVRDVAQQVALSANETERAIAEILELAERLSDLTEKEA
jgi:methyl-accepting chemotaxis protein